MSTKSTITNQLLPSKITIKMSGHGSDEVLDQVHGSETQVLTAEYKDGQLQIVEVSPFDNDKCTLQVLSDGQSESGEAKYVQVVDSSQLDLLNLTLVRCDDGTEGYRLVSTEGDAVVTDTVTCVVSDNDENDGQEEYMLVQGDDESMVVLNEADIKKPVMSPTEILEKAKALQKAKALLTRDRLQALQRRGRGRRRAGSLPPPHELLASPNFKLFLYSCKLCSFKCNAIKDMSAHKASRHGAAAGAPSRSSRGPRVQGTLQCARCPYRASVHWQLMKHVNEVHNKETASVEVEGEEERSSGPKVQLNTAEVQAADVLVCGACGFESSSRPLFRRHIELEHGATAV